MQCSDGSYHISFIVYFIVTLHFLPLSCVYTKDFEVRVDGNSISNLVDNDVTQQVIAYTGVVLKKYNGSISVAFETGRLLKCSQHSRDISHFIYFSCIGVLQPMFVRVCASFECNSFAGKLMNKYMS